MALNVVRFARFGSPVRTAGIAPAARRAFARGDSAVALERRADCCAPCPAVFAAAGLGTGTACLLAEDRASRAGRAGPAAGRPARPDCVACPPDCVADLVSVSPVSARASMGALSDSPMAKAAAVARVPFLAAADIVELPAGLGRWGTGAGNATALTRAGEPRRDSATESKPVGQMMRERPVGTAR